MLSAGLDEGLSKMCLWDCAGQTWRGAAPDETGRHGPRMPRADTMRGRPTAQQRPRRGRHRPTGGGPTERGRQPPAVGNTNNAWPAPQSGAWTRFPGQQNPVGIVHEHSDGCPYTRQCHSGAVLPQNKKEPQCCTPHTTNTHTACGEGTLGTTHRKISHHSVTHPCEVCHWYRDDIRTFDPQSVLNERRVGHSPPPPANRPPKEVVLKERCAGNIGDTRNSLCCSRAALMPLPQSLCLANRQSLTKVGGAPTIVCGARRGRARRNHRWLVSEGSPSVAQVQDVPSVVHCAVPL